MQAEPFGGTVWQSRDEDLLVVQVQWKLSVFFDTHQLWENRKYEVAAGVTFDFILTESYVPSVVPGTKLCIKILGLPLFYRYIYLYNNSVKLQRFVTEMWHLTTL